MPDDNRPKLEDNSSSRRKSNNNKGVGKMELKKQIEELSKRFDMPEEKLIKACIATIYFNTGDNTKGLTPEAKFMQEFLNDSVKLYK